MNQRPIEVARALRVQLRGAHFTTFNTLNTVFTGGLVACLLRRVLAMPSAQRPWLLVLASLLTLIACWRSCAFRRACRTPCCPSAPAPPST